MTLKLAATIPFALAIAACGEPIDGSDTADLGSDVTEAQTGPTDAPTYEPGEDGPLQSEALDEAELELNEDVTNPEGPAGEPMM